MSATSQITGAPSCAVTEGIDERREGGLLILAPALVRPHRRVLFVNSYGGADLWNKIKHGQLPAHHLWGCLELVRRGYEVALAEPLPDFYLYRNPLPHDLELLEAARSWLGKGGIIYCGHNVLYWLPLLRGLRFLRNPVISLLFAREPLDWSRAHAAIIALTPAGLEQAQQLAPRVKVAHLSWGCDLDFFPRLPYVPESFFSCGITNRDHRTLSLAARQSARPLRVVCPEPPPGLSWPPNVQVIDGGRGWNTEAKKVSYHELLHTYYARSAGSLIVIQRDDRQYTACGFTELLEVLAMGRPVIVTRTGALPTEFDVEKAGCGLHVPPEDPAALAAAIEYLAVDPARAQVMGERGRQLAESHYNIGRYATDLHNLFETL